MSDKPRTIADDREAYEKYGRLTEPLLDQFYALLMQTGQPFTIHNSSWTQRHERPRPPQPSSEPKAERRAWWKFW